MRKKRIMLVALVLLVLGGGLWFSMRREETILIHGTLPAKDLAEIKSIVRADMLRNVFPSFSWHNVHYLPAVASVTFRSRIFEIHCFGSNAVIVTTGVDPGKPNKLWSNTEAFDLAKDTNGWHLLPGKFFPNDGRPYHEKPWTIYTPM